MRSPGKLKKKNISFRRKSFGGKNCFIIQKGSGEVIKQFENEKENKIPRRLDGDLCC